MVRCASQVNVSLDDLFDELIELRAAVARVRALCTNGEDAAYGEISTTVVLEALNTP